MPDGQQWRSRIGQNLQRKRGGTEAQPIGDCWVETLMRRKYVEITKDLKRELKRRVEDLVLNGGKLDTEGLREEVQDLPRHRDDGTVDVRKWFNDVLWE